MIEFERYVPVEKRYVTYQTHRCNSNIGNLKNPDTMKTLKIVNIGVLKTSQNFLAFSCTCQSGSGLLDAHQSNE